MIHFVNPIFVRAELDIDDAQYHEFKQLAELSDIQTTVKLIDLLIKRKNQISSSPIPELPLEMLVVEWCNALPATDPISSAPEASKEPVIALKPKEETKANKKEETPESKKEAHPSSKKIEKQVVLNAWPKILSEVEKTYPSLGSLLKMVELQDVQGADILVSTEFAFHKEKLTEYSCKAKIEDCIEKILGGRLQLQVCLSDAAEKKHTGSDLQELASAFGGEIIN